MTLSISFSLPITGSMPPLRAFSVRSVPNSSSVGVLLLPFLPFLEPLNSAFGLARSFTSSSVNASASTSQALSNLAAPESPSLSRARSRCSVPTNEFLMPRASWKLTSSTRFAVGVKSFGDSAVGLPTPVLSLISSSILSSVTPFSVRSSAP